MPTSDHQALEFVRDAINGLRSDISGVYDKIDNFVDVNTTMHLRIDDRLSKLERPEPGRYAWVSPVSKILWPAALVIAVLLRDATPETRKQVTSIATTAAGLPDTKSGASIRPESASSTWVAPRTTGGR